MPFPRHREWRRSRRKWWRRCEADANSCWRRQPCCRGQPLSAENYQRRFRLHSNPKEARGGGGSLLRRAASPMVSNTHSARHGRPKRAGRACPMGCTRVQLALPHTCCGRCPRRAQAVLEVGGRPDPRQSESRLWHLRSPRCPWWLVAKPQHSPLPPPAAISTAACLACAATVRPRRSPHTIQYGRWAWGIQTSHRACAYPGNAWCPCPPRPQRPLHRPPRRRRA
mmetsp:Transcript_22599/g.57545  ORF Transcript_22599/g.57545 Transcript_22599/m.57545 type:complete len:225 (-) Transcript_22599:102-776(-)